MMRRIVDGATKTSVPS